MRLLLAAAVLVAAILPAAAADNLPEGVEQLMTCGNVYAIRANEAAAAGDDDTRLEFANMSEALLAQGDAAMEAAGFGVAEIEDVNMNYAMLTGFNHGGGMGEQMLADCLAAWDSP